MRLQFFTTLGMQRAEKKSRSKIIFFIHSILAVNIPIIQIQYKFQKSQYITK